MQSITEVAESFFNKDARFDSKTRGFFALNRYVPTEITALTDKSSKRWCLFL